MSRSRSVLIVAECGQQWVLDEQVDSLTIGRSEENEITIDDKSISRKHARVTLVDGDLFVEDLGSKNGTYLNRILVLQRERVRSRDCLRVGSVELVVMDDSSAWQACDESSSGSQRMPEKLSPELLVRLKSGDKEAANEVIGLFFDRVARAARRRLKQRRLRGSDSQDIAASVFESLWEKIDLQQIQEDQLNSPDEFWRLLCTMIRFKTEDHVRRENAEKRGGGEVRGESVFLRLDQESHPGLANHAHDGLTGCEIVALKDCHDQMMNLLGDEVLQELVTLRMENYKVTEIAEHFGKSDRWVKRRLADVREKWASHAPTTS